MLNLNFSKRLIHYCGSYDIFFLGVSAQSGHQVYMKHIFKIFQRFKLPGYKYYGCLHLAVLALFPSDIYLLIDR